ncbi:hypothetical protein LTR66_015682 [Elasticomyces elasticus]|nr:hypothetical protein LTR66_015682 [Elasticomyces elasticus]
MSVELSVHYQLHLRNSMVSLTTQHPITFKQAPNAEDTDSTSATRRRTHNASTVKEVKEGSLHSLRRRQNGQKSQIPPPQPARGATKPNLQLRPRRSRHHRPREEVRGGATAPLDLFFFVNTFRVRLASDNFYGHDYVLPVVELDPNAYRWLMSLPPAVIRIFNLTFDDWVRSQNGMHECCVTIQVRPHTAHVDVSLAGVEFVSSRSPILTPHFSPYHELTPQMRAMFAERGVELERAVRSMMAFRDQGKGLSLTEINGILVHCDRFG